MATDIAPAPGPEIKLGAPQNAPATMPPSLLEKFKAAAGDTSPNPEPPKDTIKAPETPSAPTKAQEKAVATPGAKTPEPPKKQSGIDEVRAAHERSQAKLTETLASLDATTKEKVAALKASEEAKALYDQAQKKINEDYEPRLQALTAKEKRLQEAEEQLRIQNYMATPDFHEKYVKPIADTQSELTELLNEMTATVDGVEIKASPEHFNFVLAATTANEAARRANEMFGPYLSPQIINYRQRLVGLERRRQEAAKNAQLESIEHQKRHQSAQAQFQEELRSKIASRELGYMAEFKPADDDVDLGPAFTEGLKFADEITNANIGNLGTDRFADTIAKARSRIVKAAVSDKKIAKLEAELAATKEQLAAYHKSDPDVQTRRDGKALSEGEETFESKMLAAATKHATSR